VTIAFVSFRSTLTAAAFRQPNRALGLGGVANGLPLASGYDSDTLRKQSRSIPNTAFSCDLDDSIAVRYNPRTPHTVRYALLAPRLLAEPISHKNDLSSIFLFFELYWMQNQGRHLT